MKRLAAAFLGLALLTCSPREAQQSRPAGPTFAGAPVILISIDTLRADRLPMYGYAKVATPALDALARDGMVFENAYSHCPMTLPSHVSMLTGLLPTEHGVRNNVGFTYDAAKYVPLPVLLQQKGYATGAAVSSYVLRGDSGLRAAFETYEDSLDPHPGAEFGEYQRGGDVTARLATQWIARANGRPFFLFLHLYEPHVPYAPPEPFRSRYADAYDGEIATADAIVGRFVDDLKSRGLYDDAIIVVTSDHGEGLGDHGEQQHSILLYTEAVRVPLVVKLPKSQRKGERVAAAASLADIAPTLASLTGVAMPPTPHGANLLSLPAERDIYGETLYPYLQLGWSDLRSIVRGRWHFIDSPKPELYDLAADPRETKNVIDGERRVAASMRGALEAYPPATAAQPVIDRETEAKLASLGYIGSVQARPDPRTLPNPRDHVAMLDDVQRAFALADARRYDEALTALRALLERSPRFIDARVRLGELLAEMGERDRAIDAYKQAIGASNVVSPDVMAALAGLYLDAKNVAGAEEMATLALAGAPDKARPILVRAALARRDVATADRIARSAPPTPANLLLVAEVQKAVGNFRGALATIDQAEAAARTAGLDAVYGLNAARGDLLAQSERPAEAIAAYRAELASFPHHLDAYARLAVLQFLTGDRGAMEQTLNRLVEQNPTPAAKTIASRTRTLLR